MKPDPTDQPDYWIHEYVRWTDGGDVARRYAQDIRQFFTEQGLPSDTLDNLLRGGMVVISKDAKPDHIGYDASGNAHAHVGGYCFTRMWHESVDAVTLENSTPVSRPSTAVKKREPQRRLKGPRSNDSSGSPGGRASCR